jgi:hypothetical protein
MGKSSDHSLGADMVVPREQKIEIIAGYNAQERRKPNDHYTDQQKANDRQAPVP